MVRQGRKARSRDKTGDQALRHKVELSDSLAEFEEFRAEILPVLRADLAKPNITAEEMLKKYAKFAAARGINIALTSSKMETALSAIKDILDRAHGKPVQKNENHHKFEDLTDADLDAIIVTKMNDQRRITDGKKDK